MRCASRRRKGRIAGPVQSVSLTPLLSRAHRVPAPPDGNASSSHPAGEAQRQMVEYRLKGDGGGTVSMIDVKPAEALLALGDDE
jgi:hypothetical protein